MLHNIDSQKVAQSDFLCEECVSGDRTLVLVTHDDLKMIGEGKGKGGKVFLVWKRGWLLYRFLDVTYISGDDDDDGSVKRHPIMRIK